MDRPGRVPFVDGTDLTSPIMVAMEWHSQGPDLTRGGDTETVELKLHLVDANGAEELVPLGTYQRVQEGKIEATTPMSADGPVLFEDQMVHAGVGDSFRVSWDGSHVVILHQLVDEEAGDGEWEEIGRVILADGVAVQAVLPP